MSIWPVRHRAQTEFAVTPLSTAEQIVYPELTCVNGLQVAFLTAENFSTVYWQEKNGAQDKRKRPKNNWLTVVGLRLGLA